MMPTDILTANLLCVCVYFAKNVMIVNKMSLIKLKPKAIPFALSLSLSLTQFTRHSCDVM